MIAGAATARPARSRWRAAFSPLLVVVVLAAVAFWWARRPGSIPERAEVVKALERRQYDVALDLIGRRGVATPPSALETLMKAEAEIGLGKFVDALADLSRIADNDPLAGRARLAEGQVELWRRNRARPAEQALLRAVTLAPDQADVRRELIRLYDIQGRFAERDAQFHAVAKRAPLTLDELLTWCRIKRPDGETTEIVALLRRFVAADPDDRASRVALACQLQRLGRLDEAGSLIADLPESSPDVLPIRLRIALERGDRQAQARLLATGEPCSVEVSRLRGRCALLDGQAEAARRHYREAQQAEPTDRETLLGLGQACRLIRDEAAARRWLDQVARLDALEALVQRAVTARNRRDVKLVNEIAAACEAAGRPEQARAWYQHAVGVDPLDTTSQRALFRLKASSKGPS